MAKTQLDALQEQQTALKTELAELRTQLTTCSGEECSLVRQAMEQVKAAMARIEQFEQTVAKKAADAVDARLVLLEEKLGGMDVELGNLHQSLEFVAADDSNSFSCEACGAILKIGIPKCEKCGVGVNWSKSLRGLADQYEQG